MSFNNGNKQRNPRSSIGTQNPVVAASAVDMFQQSANLMYSSIGTNVFPDASSTTMSKSSRQNTNNGVKRVELPPILHPLA